jgi:uncharacterized cupin superfamily protein
MSNRRRARPTPPPAVHAFARAYHCPDCDSDVTHIWKDDHGTWHTKIEHDDTCPMLTGHVPGRTATLAATAAAAAETGHALILLELLP